MLEGTRLLGRPADSAKDYKAQLIEAGFENVVEIRYKWPQNRWPKDRGLKELGKLDFAILYLTLDLVSFLVALRPYTRYGKGLNFF